MLHPQALLLVRFLEEKYPSLRVSVERDSALRISASRRRESKIALSKTAHIMPWPNNTWERLPSPLRMRVPSFLQTVPLLPLKSYVVSVCHNLSHTSSTEVQILRVTVKYSKGTHEGHKVVVSDYD